MSKKTTKQPLVRLCGQKNFDWGEKLWYLVCMIIHWQRALTVILISLLMLSPFNLSAAEAPQEQPLQTTEPSPGEDLGYGVGSVLASMFYSPFKVTYAGLGLITGGLGYVLSAGNLDVANNIITPAIRGNYVVTPGHLKGEEALIFVGPPPSAEPQQTSSSAPPRR